MVSILNIFIDFKCIHDRFRAVLFKSMGGGRNILFQRTPYNVKKFDMPPTPPPPPTSIMTRTRLLPPMFFIIICSHFDNLD